jgi:hypothetical protein
MEPLPDDVLGIIFQKVNVSFLLLLVCNRFNNMVKKLNGLPSNIRLVELLDELFGTHYANMHSKVYFYVTGIILKDQRNINGLAINKNCFYLIRYLVEQNSYCPINSETFNILAKKGDLRLIKWYREYTKIIMYPKTANYIAAKNGYLDILKWGTWSPGKKYDINLEIILSAIEGRHMKTIKWCIDNNRDNSEIIKSALEKAKINFQITNTGKIELILKN